MQEPGQSGRASAGAAVVVVVVVVGGRFGLFGTLRGNALINIIDLTISLVTSAVFLMVESYW
jgi:hypothetical protein